MLVPTVALADGVTVGGDLRLRWDYTGPETNDSSNSSSAVTNIDLDAAINDNVSFAVSLRNDFAFGDGGGGLLNLQEAYASVGDLGSASGMLAGWSLDVGRMNNPDGGRIINSDDWGGMNQGTAPVSNDGYHLASDMGGIGIGIWYFGGGSVPSESAGSGDSKLGAAFDLGDMAGGFADIDVAYWSGSAAVDTSNVGININNIASENLAGVDLDVTYATRDNDTADDGTLTGISVGYAMEGFDLSFSNTVADEFWGAISDAAHGTNGIADMTVGSNAAGADVDNTTIGVSFSPMDGVTASVDFITLAQDSTGDDIGTEVDVVLGWECGSDVHMTIGYASFSDDDGSAVTTQDCDYFYLQTGWAV
jgi:hypothetical protein